MKFHSAEQTVAWYRDRYKSGELELRPPFQRRPVWVARQKSYLIESILLGLPVPEVYVQHTIDDEGNQHFAVVDGQQRIRTVMQFIGVEKDPEEEESNEFALDKLDPDSAWFGARFADLEIEDQKRILGYRFAGRWLDTDDDDVVRNMFIRLNKYLTKLNDQELRNAYYTGPFVELSVKLADDDYWFSRGLISAAEIRRMKDVALMSDLLIAVMHGPQGGSAKVLDEYYKQYEDYDTEFPGQKQALRRFTETRNFITELYPSFEDLRWANRTDFYSLFTALSYALAFLERKRAASNTQIRRALDDFAVDVDRRLANESVKVPEHVISYVRAVEKGANEKKRRADRHLALLTVLEPYFKKKAS